MPALRRRETLSWGCLEHEQWRCEVPRVAHGEFQVVVFMRRGEGPTLMLDVGVGERLTLQRGGRQLFVRVAGVVDRCARGRRLELLVEEEL
jgi:hypothetical protein